MPDALELWALLVLGSAAALWSSHLMLKRIEWSISMGAPSPFTWKRLCWDARRLRSAFADVVAKALVTFFLAIFRDAESRAVRELTAEEVEGLRMSLDEHHGRRYIAVPVKLHRTMEQALLN